MLDRSPEIIYTINMKEVLRVSSRSNVVGGEVTLAIGCISPVRFALSPFLVFKFAGFLDFIRGKCAAKIHIKIN